MSYWPTRGRWCETEIGWRTCGAEWLSFRYVEDKGRIFADLYGPTGEFIRRKSTTLSTRVPPPERMFQAMMRSNAFGPPGRCEGRPAPA